MTPSMTSRHQRNWDLRAAGNFIGGGTGSGLIVTAGLAAAAGVPFRLTLAIGLACVVAGLSLVWLEIGKPWRALNVFFHPHTSWMTREAIVAGILVPAGLIGAVAGSTAVTAVAAVLACGFLYCQARMLRAARGIPAWRQQEIVPLILSTGLAEGGGLYLLVGAQTSNWLVFALFAGLLREVAWLAYRAGLGRTPAAARSVAVFGTPPARFVRAAQLAGLVLIALALAAAVLAAPPAVILALAGAGGALAALAGWGLKVMLITRAAFTRALAIPVIPIRGRSTHARQS